MQRSRGLEVFTMGGTGEVLPVFSFEGEAEMFLGLGLAANVWQVRKTTCGELVSVLYGPCRDVEHVTLDPLPETMGEGTFGFVSLRRKAFVGVLVPSDLMLPALEEPSMAGLAS